MFLLLLAPSSNVYAMPSGHSNDRFVKEMVVNAYKWLIQDGQREMKASVLAGSRIHYVAKILKLHRTTVAAYITYISCVRYREVAIKQAFIHIFCWDMILYNLLFAALGYLCLIYIFTYSLLTVRDPENS